MNRVERLQRAGVSIWLDTLSRELLESGDFERYVREYGVSGATSNPTIFERAISGSDSYDAQLRSMPATESARMAFFELALADVREAAELLRPLHDASSGRDGFVSFQCTPAVSHDTTGTIDQALALWRRLGLPNVMIKVPATTAGAAALEALAV